MQELTLHIKTLLEQRLKPATVRAFDKFRNFLDVMDSYDNSTRSLHSQTAMTHCPFQSTGKRILYNSIAQEALKSQIFQFYKSYDEFRSIGLDVRVAMMQRSQTDPTHYSQLTMLTVMMNRTETGILKGIKTFGFLTNLDEKTKNILVAQAAMPVMFLDASKYVQHKDGKYVFVVGKRASFPILINSVYLFLDDIGKR